MAVLIISRNESKLIEQKNELSELYGTDVRHIAFDFTSSDDSKTQFYKKLETCLATLHSDGGIGLLINNVGIANEHPKAFDEFDVPELENMIHCNIFSIVNMTTAVLKYMKERKSGCVISISSGSGNMPSSFLALYSATK
jgi:17beta-estradiol 17-dehydrogenase / very-long-chain 3-oxoacyl-CoA reductase